jgi:hypothetical protein
MPRQRKEGSPVRRLTIALPESLEAAVLAVNQATAVPVTRMLDLLKEDMEIRMCGSAEPGQVGPPDDGHAAIANLIAMIEADDIARREEAKQKLGLGPRRVEGPGVLGLPAEGVVDLMEALKSSLAAAPECAATGLGDLSSVPDLRRTEEVSPRLAHMFEEDREPATVEDAEGHQGIVVEPTEDELAPVVQLERREVER